MRILYVSHSFGAWGSPDRIWDRNLRDTLRSMGHSLLDPGFDPNRAHDECSHDRTGRARERYSEQLVRDVRALLVAGSLDLMFTYYDTRNILPAALEEIRRLGVLTVNFFCNAAHQFYKVEAIAPYFDYCMVPERVALEKYRQAGARPIHVQMAANPAFYRPIELPHLYDASFVGTRYLNREDHLLALARAGLNVHVFGSGWVDDARPEPAASPTEYARRTALRLRHYGGRLYREWSGRRLRASHYHGPITDDEMVALYSQSRIVLGLSDVVDPAGRVMRHIRLRDFEVPMCGAFYMTGYQEELGEYYEIGREIECYDTIDELVDKADFYLANDRARDAVRRAGFARAGRDHTWERRFGQLFAAMGLS